MYTLDEAAQVLSNALGVLTLDERIETWLLSNDPQALKQALQAREAYLLWQLAGLHGALNQAGPAAQLEQARARLARVATRLQAAQKGELIEQDERLDEIVTRRHAPGYGAEA